ncbi:MAG: hypothetical protein HY532_05245 [Chloroflexi bacterium]|nr:hypothetical protein [Chloroflexota bacterium]
MAKPKKPATEMTDQELEKRVFPKKVLDELKRIAHKDDEPETKEPIDSSRK